MNAAQQQLLTGAKKSAISAGCGVILANVIDVQQTMFSWPWCKHVLIVMFFVTIVAEARFWKQWADSGDASPKQ